MAVERPVSLETRPRTTREDLRALIHEELAHLIEGSCCLLDVPGHRNIGDLLIWRGEMDFLSSIGKKPGYVSATGSCDERRVAGYDTILLHGGGNFGDLWHRHQLFRESIVSRFRDRRVILFPQTVHFQNPDNLESARQSFGTHPDLYLCARDAVSQAFLERHFPDNEVRLLPDMAFCIDGLDRRLAVPRRDQWLLLERIDQESAGRSWPLDPERFEVRDWPTLSAPLHQRIERRLLTDAHRAAHRLRLRLPPGKGSTDGFSQHLTEKAIRIGAEFVSAYELVVSTRLHGHILCLLLGIPNVLVDNSYGKNRTFFDAWTCDFPGTGFASDIAGLRKATQAMGFLPAGG
jgi:pyruvyl transferase EpsO